MQETYRLSEDGLTLDVTFKISDPVLLTAPVMREIKFRKEVDRNFVIIPCDPRAADRHVTMVKSGRKAGQAVAVATPQSNFVRVQPSKKSWLKRLIGK